VSRDHTERLQGILKAEVVANNDPMAAGSMLEARAAARRGSKARDR
jgi:ABC-type sugar transport system substrate-binding protein